MSYKADTVYSYKKGGTGSASGSNVRTLLTVSGKSESVVLAELKRKHGSQSEITIHTISWK
jgi:hypothetical protein